MGAVGQRRRGGGRQRCQNRRRGGQPAGVRRGGRGARLRARRGDVEVPQLVHVLVVQRRRRRLMGVQIGDGSVIGHRRRRKRVQRRVRLGGAVAPRRGRRLFRGQFTLGRTTLQVRGQTEPQRILHVQPFDALQVARHLRHAFPEPHPVVVHRVLVGVVSERIQAWNNTSRSRWGECVFGKDEPNKNKPVASYHPSRAHRSHGFYDRWRSSWSTACSHATVNPSFTCYARCWAEL
jgi:hypothetical protein